jgi:hypothetical protein
MMQERIYHDRGIPPSNSGLISTVIYMQNLMSEVVMTLTLWRTVSVRHTRRDTHSGNISPAAIMVIPCHKSTVPPPPTHIAKTQFHIIFYVFTVRG